MNNIVFFEGLKVHLWEVGGFDQKFPTPVVYGGHFQSPRKKHLPTNFRLSDIGTTVGTVPVSEKTSQSFVVAQIIDAVQPQIY